MFSHCFIELLETDGDFGGVHRERDSIFIEHDKTGLAEKLVNAVGIEEPQMGRIEQPGSGIGESAPEQLGPHSGVRHIWKGDDNATSIREQLKRIAQNRERVLEVLEDVKKKNDVETPAQCSFEVQLLHVPDNHLFAPLLRDLGHLGVVFDAPYAAAHLTQRPGH